MSEPELMQPQFILQRIYLKDASFESPNAPDVFLATWNPKVDLELQTVSQPLNPEVFEVVISATITAKVDDKVAFLVEIKQAGIFSISNFPAEHLPQVLAITCPNIIFPYLREAVTDLVSKGSFPQLLLEPVNFEMLYHQQALQAENANSNLETETTH